jgi:hypothetical protein
LKRVIYIIVSAMMLLLSAFTEIAAQTDTTRIVGGVVVTQDTLLQDSLGIDVGIRQEARSPHRATMLAAALPGAGQIYNRKYWKIPVVYVGFGALGYAVYLNSDNFNKFMKGYQDFTDLIPDTDSYIELIRGIDPSVYDPVLHPDTYLPSEAQWIKEQLRNRIDYYKRYRDLSYIGIAVWYLITIIDANVDASLSDYDISDQLTLSLRPEGIQTYTGQTFAWNFRLVKLSK